MSVLIYTDDIIQELEFSQEMAEGFVAIGRILAKKRKLPKVRQKKTKKHRRKENGSFYVLGKKLSFNSFNFFQGMIEYAKFFQTHLPLIKDIRWKNKPSQLKVDKRWFLPDYLRFYQDYWQLISLTWFPLSINSDQELKKSKKYMGLEDVSYLFSNLSWQSKTAISFLKQILNLGPKKNINQKSYETFAKNFQPGFVYKFKITNHYFMVIWESDLTLFYVDYFKESGREHYFRADQLEIKEFLNYISRYWAQDHWNYFNFNDIVARTEALDDIISYGMDVEKITQYPILSKPDIKKLKLELLINLQQNPSQKPKYQQFRAEMVWNLLMKEEE